MPLSIWKEAPEERTYLNYFLPNINGKKYPELDIKFIRTGELTRKTFNSVPNPIIVKNIKQFHWLVPFCVAEVDVKYSMNHDAKGKVRYKLEGYDAKDEIELIFPYEQLQGNQIIRDFSTEFFCFEVFQRMLVIIFVSC